MKMIIYDYYDNRLMYRDRYIENVNMNVYEKELKKGWFVVMNLIVIYIYIIYIIYDKIIQTNKNKIKYNNNNNNNNNNI